MVGLNGAAEGVRREFEIRSTGSYWRGVHDQVCTVGLPRVRMPDCGLVPRINRSKDGCGRGDEAGKCSTEFTYSV
jgi:hypothetical protein